MKPATNCLILAFLVTPIANDLSYASNMALHIIGILDCKLCRSNVKERNSWNSRQTYSVTDVTTNHFLGEKGG